MKRAERVAAFILVARDRKRLVKVKVEGRVTKLPGVIITPEFVGWTGSGKPKLRSDLYRVGTDDGYALNHFNRLKDANKYLGELAKAKLDLRWRARKRLKRWLERHRNLPLVKKYFTMYGL